MTKKFFLISLGLLIIIAAAVGFTPLFKLRTILCQVDVNPCPPELITYLSKLQQRNLLFINRSRLAQNLKVLYPDFLNTRIFISLPHTLRVALTSRTPVALLVTESGPFPIDTTGIVLKSAPATNLPVIKLATPSADLITIALNLITLLNQAFIGANLVSSTQSGVLDAQLSSGQLARFSLLKDLPVQVNSLQVILHKSTIVPSAGVIDVRFDKPVLVN